MYCGFSTASEVFLIFTTRLYQFLVLFFFCTIYSDEPEVFLYEYSQPAILHAAHFRWVAKVCIYGRDSNSRKIQCCIKGASNGSDTTSRAAVNNPWHEARRACYAFKSLSLHLLTTDSWAHTSSPASHQRPSIDTHREGSLTSEAQLILEHQPLNSYFNYVNSTQPSQLEKHVLDVCEVVSNNNNLKKEMG